MTLVDVLVLVFVFVLVLLVMLFEFVALVEGRIEFFLELLSLSCVDSMLDH